MATHPPTGVLRRLILILGVVAVLMLLLLWLLLRERSVEQLYGPYPDGADAYRPDVNRTVAPRPNVIIILLDDLGSHDVGAQGNTVIETPNMDSIAEEGVRFTQFYSSASVCAPARAGLLTGRYPFRTGIVGNTYPEDEPVGRRLARKFGVLTAQLGVLDIREKFVARGLSDHELTLAEGLKEAGYSTAMVGKWHLGDYTSDPAFNPTRHGFDHYLGVPYSNDMVPLPVYRNTTEIESNLGLDEDQARLTPLYTNEALEFLADRLKTDPDTPFFLYMAHTFPHQPNYASDEFAGRSEGGAFGDTVEELDWSIGQVLEFLDEHGLQENTLVLFTSDNGPWYEGSAGNLRGRKGQSMEGGFRVPFFARWPGHIPAGTVVSQPAMNIDLYPTIFELAGVSLPSDRMVDGRSLLSVLLDPARELDRRPLYFYHYDQLEALRFGPWKYYPKVNRYTWPIPLDTASIPNRIATAQIGRRWPLLYNLDQDPGEAYNLIDRHPDVLAHLASLFDLWQNQMEQKPRGFFQ